MVKPKAIFVDIDGTLLSHKLQRVPKSAVDALHFAKNEGASIFIATGRHMVELDDVSGIDEIQFDGFVTLNGGHCTAGGKTVFKNPLPPGLIRTVIERLEETPFPCMFCDENGTFINIVTDEVISLQTAIGVTQPEIRNPREALTSDVLQLVSFGTAMQDFFESLPGAKLTTLFGGGFDIVNATTNKWEGILHVLRHIGVEPADAVTIGDANNDREMLTNAGYSVAMGNADEDVKECADYITGHVDEDGLAKAIYHLFGVSGS